MHYKVAPRLAGIIVVLVGVAASVHAAPLCANGRTEHGCLPAGHDDDEYARTMSAHAQMLLKIKEREQLRAASGASHYPPPRRTLVYIQYYPPPRPFLYISSCTLACLLSRGHTYYDYMCQTMLIRQ